MVPRETWPHRFWISRFRNVPKQLPLDHRHRDSGCASVSLSRTRWSALQVLRCAEHVVFLFCGKPGVIDERSGKRNLSGGISDREWRTARGQPRSGGMKLAGASAPISWQSNVEPQSGGTPTLVLSCAAAARLAARRDRYPALTRRSNFIPPLRGWVLYQLRTVRHPRPMIPPARCLSNKCAERILAANVVRNPGSGAQYAPRAGSSEAVERRRQL